MADKVTVWFDAEADYLEVQFKCGFDRVHACVTISLELIASLFSNDEARH